MFDGKLEADDLNPVPMLQSGKRCGVQFTPWMDPCTCTTDPNATTCPCRACVCYMIEEGTK